MTALTFPSDAFPALATITVEIPDDWSAISVPGTILAAAAPEVPGEFRPNVVVSITRFGADYSLDVAANAVIEKFAGLEQAQEIGRDRVTVDGVEWVHIESTFVDPRVGTLVQAAHLAVIAHGPVADLVQVTGSVTGVQAKDGVLDILRTIQRSARATA